jgi:hypothetical protein
MGLFVAIIVLILFSKGLCDGKESLCQFTSTPESRGRVDAYSRIFPHN